VEATLVGVLPGQLSRSLVNPVPLSSAVELPLAESQLRRLKEGMQLLRPKPLSIKTGEPHPALERDAVENRLWRALVGLRRDRFPFQERKRRGPGQNALPIERSSDTSVSLLADRSDFLL